MIYCKLVFQDWRKKGGKSIYYTPLGIDLSTGDLHSGTVFAATVILRDDIEREIEQAWEKHRAYPVFALIGEK